MNLVVAILVHCGGPGSGCNPEAGRCGRAPGEGGASVPIDAGEGGAKYRNALEQQLNKVKDQDLLKRMAANGLKVKVHGVGDAEPYNTWSGGHGEAHYDPATGTVHLYRSTPKGAVSGVQGTLSPGILAFHLNHEIGHAFEDQYERQKYFSLPKGSFLKGKYHKLYQQNKNAVGEYGAGRPNEHFAEAFKMYVEEPEKLQKKAPDIYDYMKEKTGRLA